MKKNIFTETTKLSINRNFSFYSFADIIHNNVNAFCLVGHPKAEGAWFGELNSLRTFARPKEHFI